MNGNRTLSALSGGDREPRMTDDQGLKKTGLSLGKLLPVALLCAGVGAFFVLGLDEYVTLETLRENRVALLEWTSANQALAVGVYMLAYVIVVAFSLPGGAVMTLTGGFVFGTVFGTLYTVVGATIGAIVIFLAARYAFYDFFHAKAGNFLHKMEDGFRENAMSYILVLRLVPIFPFFIVNLVPAFLGVPVRVYFIGTLLGIIPGTAVFSSVGNGLGAVFDAGQDPDLGIIFSPEIIGPIIGLAVLSLIPAVYKKINAKKA